MGTVELVVVAGAGWVMAVVGALALVSGAARARRACDAIEAAQERQRAIVSAWRRPGWANVRALSPEEELEVLRFGLYPPISDIDR